MNKLFNRVEVYISYFLEYFRYGEFRSITDAFLYMLTGKSYAKGNTIQTRMGLFKTRPGSLDFQYINYAYELDIKRFIEKEEFDVFIDIGACLGEYCIWLGKKGKRCIAFEPVKESYAMICENIRLNSLEENVSAYNFGLGSAHSIEYFELNETNPGSSHKVKEPSDRTGKLEIFALDEIMNKLNLNQKDLILVKIDIEGMEVEMLEGAKVFFSSFPNLVLIVEEKLSGESNIRNFLLSIGQFTFGKIDEYNIYARKILK